MAGQTLFSKVMIRATGSSALFDAVSGYRVKLLKGVVAVANCTLSCTFQLLEDSVTSMVGGCPTKGAVFNFDFGPQGMPATATDTSWRILTTAEGTLTAWFIGTTE